MNEAWGIYSSDFRQSPFCASKHFARWNVGAGEQKENQRTWIQIWDRMRTAESFFVCLFVEDLCILVTSVCRVHMVQMDIPIFFQTPRFKGHLLMEEWAWYAMMHCSIRALKNNMHQANGQQIWMKSNQLQNRNVIHIYILITFGVLILVDVDLNLLLTYLYNFYFPYCLSFRKKYIINSGM